MGHDDMEVRFTGVQLALHYEGTLHKPNVSKSESEQGLCV